MTAAKIRYSASQFLNRYTLRFFMHTNCAFSVLPKNNLLEPKCNCIYQKRCNSKIYNPRFVYPLFLRAENHGEKLAIIDNDGMYTYKQILDASYNLADLILKTLSVKEDLKEVSIAILCPNNVSYVISQWAVWISGAKVVPLCKTHPPSEWKYFVEDSECKILLHTKEFDGKVNLVLGNNSQCQRIKLDENILLSLVQDKCSSNKENTEINAARQNRLWQLAQSNKLKNRDAMIVYTSGTTGRPKGVVHSFHSLQSQMDAMCKAWAWSSNDVILHVLPLHHVHGIVNVLMTSLHVGALCIMHPEFDAKKVWSAMLDPISTYTPRTITLFMAVPTIYAKLIEEFERQFSESKPTALEFFKATCMSRIRLMVSGSSALPESIMNKWEEITGHRLLERYGMTEIGMALTNPLNGPRLNGSVGLPFPTVTACIAKPNVYAEHGYDVIVEGDSFHTRVRPGCEGEFGELYIRGPSLFKEYYKRPKETEATYTKDGWFKTGDTAVFSEGVYKIKGRTSVDIIKSGGYKISAFDIERHLLTHDSIKEACVVGLPDVTWGQKVAAVVVLKNSDNVTLSLNELRSWARDKMPSYHIPSVLKIVKVLPRNAMGKLNKKELTNAMFSKELK